MSRSISVLFVRLIHSFVQVTVKYANFKDVFPVELWIRDTKIRRAALLSLLRTLFCRQILILLFDERQLSHSRTLPRQIFALLGLDKEVEIFRHLLRVRAYQLLGAPPRHPAIYSARTFGYGSYLLI